MIVDTRLANPYFWEVIGIKNTAPIRNALLVRVIELIFLRTANLASRAELESAKRKAKRNKFPVKWD